MEMEVGVWGFGVFRVGKRLAAVLVMLPIKPIRAMLPKYQRKLCTEYCFEATCSIFVLQASCFKEPMPIRNVQLPDPRYHLWSVNLLILQSWLYELQ